MSLLPRIRLALARRPWLYWLAVGIAAAATWLGVTRAQAQVAQARDEWGTTRRVWVTDGPIAAGSPVRASAHDYPMAMLPPSAITSLPATGVAARSIAAGEVLVADDLAGGGPVPDGWLVFAVPGDGAPSLTPGDAVMVFGSGQQWCDGVVAATTDSQVEVGVDAECAAPMSAQLALGAVTLARRP